jgi:uncharacterized membrane protein (DUF373 family)
MRFWRPLVDQLTGSDENEKFLNFVKRFETLIPKILALTMVVVILVATVDLIILLSREILAPPIGFFNITLIEIFGLFLNILIAFELLENITAYLRKHTIQAELVLVTSLVAVARKIIIFDFEKTSGIDLLGLAFAVIALAASYWIVRRLQSSV